MCYLLNLVYDIQDMFFFDKVILCLSVMFNCIPLKSTINLFYLIYVTYSHLDLT